MVGTFDILLDYLRLRDPKNKVLKQIGTSSISKDDVELPYFLGSMDTRRKTLFLEGFLILV